MSDGLSASVFLLVVQLPAKVSDGLSYSVFLLLSFRLISISFFPQWPADFYDTFLQRRDSCDIFASRQGSFRSFTFSFFAAQLLFVFLVLREEFAFCFRPFPEMTLLDRRRRRGAVLS